MVDWKIRSMEEAQDLVYGCCFMGTGGGGGPDLGLDFLRQALEKGREMKLTDPNDLPDDAWICTGAYVGSIAPPSEEMLALKEKLGLERKVEHEIVEAVRELESYTGVRIAAIAACELGGLNTPAPISAAAALGIPAVDGDYAGRAIPASVHLKISIAGKEIWPRAFCDFAGNTTVIKRASSHAMMERIQKYLSMTTVGLIGGAGHLLNGMDMKGLINRGSISRCLQIGRLLRSAKEQGKQMAAFLARELGGWLLFQGVVEKKTWENKQGYMIGQYQMTGTEEFRGQSFRVWFQNENMISWLNDKPHVTCPDILSVLNLETGLPPTNDKIDSGDRLAVLGLPAVEFYRQPAALRVLGPAYFGFDIPYRPIESLVAAKPA
jgi:DUF917 family protein